MAFSTATGAFKDALDKSASMQIGENGSSEHAWTASSGDAGLTQLYFQMVRATSPDETYAIRTKYRELLEAAFGVVPPGATSCASCVDREAARRLFMLIGNVRDIDAGKGERQLAYALIWELYAVSPALAQYAIYSCVHSLDVSGEKTNTGLQYGGWSDIKYFCDAVSSYAGVQDHPLIIYALNLLAAQLRTDAETKAADADATISLAPKWMPKQNVKKKKHPDGSVTRKPGRFTWQYGMLADIMFPFAKTARTEESLAAAKRKACTSLHKLYAPLNKACGTVQIAMSAGAKEDGIWDQLSFGRAEDGSTGHYNVTGATLRRHPKAWKNLTGAGEQRSSNADRVACAENYVSHMARVSEGKGTTRGKTLNTYELVRDALTLGSDSTERARINSQWAANSEGAPSTGMMLPCIDVSSSMDCDSYRPLHSAIGTGLRISEKAHPSLRNRAITFSTTPSWFDLSTSVDFVSRVNKVRNDRNWGGSTDLIKVAEMVVGALKASKVPPAEAQEVVIVVLSDMQIDGGATSGGCYGYGGGGASWDDTAFERMSRVCRDAGYEPFHFVWWNLRTTSGFPAPTNALNTTMVSGYNAALLKSFEGKGIEVLRDYTPERMLQDILAHERLRPLGALFDHTYPEA